MQHSPYSLDQALCNFILFPKLKIHLKSKRFEEMEDIKRNLMVWLNTRSKMGFQRCFYQWKNSWSFLKEINISFIFHFCLSRYSFSLDIFWTHLAYIDYYDLLPLIFVIFKSANDFFLSVSFCFCSYSFCFPLSCKFFRYFSLLEAILI